MDDKYHPIIDRPWEYELSELRYRVGLDGTTPCIDLTLQRGATTRRLRFTFPQDLQIEQGCFPQPTHGMVILDVRDRQLSDIGVQVTDREGTRGALTFWAKEVIDLEILGDDEQSDADGRSLRIRR